jgi:hypothetical protein
MAYRLPTGLGKSWRATPYALRVRPERAAAWSADGSFYRTRTAYVLPARSSWPPAPPSYFAPRVEVGARERTPHATVDDFRVTS